MDVEYTGRQTTVTKKLKQQTEAGLLRIERVIGAAASVQVTLTTGKRRQVADVRVQTRSLKLVATCEAGDMEGALRDALAKIEQQAIRHKKKTASIKRHPKGEVKLGHGSVVAEVAAPAVTKTAAKNSVAGKTVVPMVVHSFPPRTHESEPHVERTTEGVALRPMSVEEAVKEASFRNHDVFVFRDHSGRAMVLYRRRDGKMGLIEVP